MCIPILVMLSGPVDMTVVRRIGVVEIQLLRERINFHCMESDMQNHRMLGGNEGLVDEIFLILL